MRAMKYVLLYRSAADVLETAPVHYPAHRARVDAFHARGDLELIGTFADPVKDGSMAIFAGREAAEEFVAGDPFVLNGVVASWELREWDEVLGG
jgi:uncharacterized protein YciI